MNPLVALNLILDLYQQLTQARKEADVAQQRIVQLEAEKAEKNGSPKTTMAANAGDLA